jgi:penicillin amidase
MNMLFTDKAGNIGQVLAVRLPQRRRDVPPDLVLDAADPEADWEGSVGSMELPHSFNPPEGYLVSANNRPVEANVPIGYFFSPADRIQRISALLAEEGRIDADRLKHIQRDVLSLSALELKQTLLDKLRETGLTETRDPWERELVKFLSVWDGRYHPDSRGALSFELLMFNLARLLYGQTFTLAETATYASVGRIKLLMTEDLEAMAPDELWDALARALARAADRLSKLDNWGSIHRYALWHPLGAIPVGGRRYRFFEYEAPGASDTVMKTAHGLSDQRHRTGFGAAARHVSDLADDDENHFVVLGGQDGWINSANFLDQVPLWLERAYVRVPLRLDTVRQTFPYRTELRRAADTSPRPLTG